MRRLGPGGLALLYSLSACSERVEATQLVVMVSADAPLSRALKALKVQLFPLNASDERAPSRVQTFPLDTPGAPALPLSFGITRSRAEQLLLVVKGCGDGPACEQPAATQKMRVRFVPHRTLAVSVVLTRACADAELRCAGLMQTCAPLDGERASAGTCLPVAEALAVPVEAGDELFPFIPEPPTPDASTPSDAPSETALCPPNSCTEDYPCERDQGGGLICRGQHADWPMPDALPGARVAPRYDVDALPGVVRDTVTGLSWQREVPATLPGCSGRESTVGDSCTWDEARAYCAGLSLAGEGFRLPTKVELESLLDFRPEVRTLDPEIFFLTSESLPYWTGSTYLSTESRSRAYAVSFSTALTNSEEKQRSLAVRCVRSPDEPPRAITDRYVPRPSEALLGDARTGLVWSARAVCGIVPTYEAAVDLCAAMAHLRVPSAKELLTLVDPTRSRPAIDPIFAGTPEAGLFWTSTPAKFGASRALVASANGHLLTQGLASRTIDDMSVPPPYCVRCIQ